jgi:hypothetical protein
MKALVPHGRWGPTLREMGLDVRCAQLYAFAYRHTNHDSLLRLPKHVTFTALLHSRGRSAEGRGSASSWSGNAETASIDRDSSR